MDSIFLIMVVAVVIILVESVSVINQTVGKKKIVLVVPNVNRGPTAVRGLCEPAQVPLI